MKFHSSFIRNLFLISLIATTFFSSLPVWAQQYSKTDAIGSSVFMPASGQKTQLLFTAADLGNPISGVIDRIYFRKSIGNPSSVTLSNFQINLGFTAATSFPVNGTTFFTDLAPVFAQATYTANAPTGNSYFFIDLNNNFELPQGTNLVVELIATASTSSSFAVTFGNGPSSPNNKRLTSNIISATTGTASTTWFDFGFDFALFPNTPSNDLCSNAQTLTLNNICQPIFGSSASANQDLSPISCNGFTSNTANDVWYQFTAQSSTDSIFVGGLGGFDPIITLYGGTCTGLVQLACSDATVMNGIEFVAPGNLVPGQTYFFRVYGWAGADGMFEVCGKTNNIITQTNDNCANATLLNINATCISTLGSNSGATQSQAPILCEGATSSQALDVWYRFTAQTATDSVIVERIAGIDPVIELFSGSCGNLISLACSDDPQSAAAIEKVAPGTLIPGQTYYVRVYGFGTFTGSFNICVRQPISLASNDECNNAISLTSNIICQPIIGSNINATQSLAPVNCLGATSQQANDVWYTFVAGANGDSVIVDPDGNFDAVVELFTGPCSNLVSIGCSDNPQVALATEKISPGNLVPGQTYRVRVYGWGTSTGTFSICIRRTTSSGVSNDNCASAQVLSGGNSCIPIQGSTLGATSSGLSTCTGNPDDDVWFRLNVPTTGQYAIQVRGLGSFDPVLQVYDGICTALQPLICKNRTGAGGSEDTLRSFVANQSVFIRVFHSGVGTGTGTFEICVFRISAPANDNCFEGTTLTPSATCNPTTGTTWGSAQNLAPANCSGFTSTSANDVWYRFVATANNHRVRVGSLNGFDPVVEAFRGSCSNLVSLGCVDDSLPGSSENLFLSGLVIGQTYFVRVYGYSETTPFGNFNICVTGVNCTTTPGAASTSVADIVANGRVGLNLTGQTPGALVQWQVSFDNGANFVNAGTADAILPDTFFVFSPTTQTFVVRALVTATGCAPAFSNNASFLVRCATAFAEPNAYQQREYISNFSFNTINNSSIPLPQNGSYENFSNISTSVCKGRPYQATISTQTNANNPIFRAMWIDFNNDGDFADAGENVIAPTTVNSANITIPNSSVTGPVRLRIMAFDPGSAQASSDPCFSDSDYASGEIEEYTVELLAEPTTANAGSNASTCSPTFTLAGNTPQVGQGTWTVISGSGNFANVNTPNTQVSGLALGQNIFRWTIANACTSYSSQVTITYIPAQAAQAGADQNICSSNTQLAGNQPTGNAGGTWTILSGTGTISNPNIPNPQITNLGIGLNQFIWTISTPGCGSRSDTVDIIRSAPPTPASAGPDQVVCAPTAQLSGNSILIGTGTWTLVSGSGQFVNSNLNSTVVTGLGNGSNVFRWTSSTAGCPSSFDEVTIVYNPSIQANAGQNQTICSEQISLNGNSPGNGTGLWTLISGSGIISNASSPNASVAGLGIGVNQFVWTLSYPNCPSNSDTVTITRIQNQTANAGEDQSICGGQATMNATPVLSGSGTWTIVSGSATIVNPTNPNTLVTGLANGITILRWSISNPPCQQISDEVVLNNLGNVTIAQAGPDQIICNNQVSLAANTAAIGVGQWSLISGSGQISAPSSPNSAVTNLGVGLNVFRWTILNGNCPPSFDDVIITRIAAPTVANAGSDQSICTNSALLSANVPTIGTGMWTLVSGTGQIQNNGLANTTVTGLSAGANTFRWTISNAPCASSSDEVVITTTSNSISADAGSDQLVCSSSTMLGGNQAGSGVGTWTLVSGSGVFDNPNNPSSGVSGLSVGTNVFRWTITNGSCPPSSDDVSIGRVDQTSPANAGPDQNICTSTAILNANVPQSGTGSWILVSGTGTIANPNLATTTVSGLGNGENIFRWTITNLPCGSTSDEVIISTTLSATTANAGSDQTVCGSSGQLIGNSPGTGTGIWTVVSGSGNITNPSGNVSSVTGLSPGPNVFRWSITTGTCPTSTDEVTITSISNPVAANAGADQSICGSSAVLIANNPTQGIGIWSIVSGSGQIANPSSASTTVAGLGSGTNVFRWTITNSPCPPSFDDVVINATPGNVSAQAGQDRTVCGSTIFLNATAPIAGFGVWTLVSGSGIITQPGNPVSEITNLGPGPNTFAWTVTSGNCTASDLVVITRESNNLNLGDDTVACIGTSVILDAGSGFSSYQWFDNSAGQTLTVGSSGLYYVTATTTTGCTFSDSVSVIFVVCNSVQEDLVQTEKIDVYPNPNLGIFSLKVEGKTLETSYIKVINSLGAQVWQGELPPFDGITEKSIQLYHPSAGVYFIDIHSDKRKYTRKILIR